MNCNPKFLLYLSRTAELYPIGHSKYAPGTIASFVSILIGYFLILKLDIKFYLIFLFIFIIISYFLCEVHLKLNKKKDPKEVVVDEVSGQFVAMLACIQSEKLSYIFWVWHTNFIIPSINIMNLACNATS